MEWQLSEAKNKFSEVVNLALEKGPQIVHRRKDTVVILSKEEYDMIIGKKKSFKEFLMTGPSLEGLDLKRNKTGMRKVKL